MGGGWRVSRDEGDSLLDDGSFDNRSWLLRPAIAFSAVNLYAAVAAITRKLIHSRKTN